MPSVSISDLALCRARWTAAKTSTQRVIVAGDVLKRFGPTVTDGQQELGWPCEMLRAISRMQAVSI